jgi:hypothetical protein
MSQTYNRSYVYRDNVNNAVYFDDFIGIGPGSAGFQGYPSGPTGITGSYIFHDNITSFVNSGTGETGFNFIYVSGETGPINLGTIGLSGFYDCRNLVPATSLTYDLGNSEKRWRSMYVGPGTIDFLGNSEASATIGVNPLGFVYTPTGFTTPTANLGAKSPGSSSNYSGGWAFTSDDNNNSIIYELTELGEGITGTQTFLNYENTSIDNYSETITISNEVSAFNLNGTFTNVNIEIPSIRNQPLVLTNSCDTNATIIHNGTMYYNNVLQTENVNISTKSVVIHWVPNWENNTSDIFIFDQGVGSTGPTGSTGSTGATGATGPTGSTGPNPYSYLGYTSSRVKYNKIGTSNNYIIELPSSSNVFLLVGDENAPNGLDGTPTSNTTIYGMTGGTNGRVVTLLFNADTTHHIAFHNQQTGIHDMFYLANSTDFTLSKQSSITFMYSTDFFQYNNSSEGYWFMISHT